MRRSSSVAMRSTKFATGVAMCAMTSLAAHAGTIKLADSFGANPGGEFKATTFAGATLAPTGANVLDAGSKFQTFCVEYTENISFGPTYSWGLNTGAIGGGVSGGGQNLVPFGGTGVGDPLGSMTAYVYSRFWNGVLTNYSYTSATRASDATELQKLIWYLEGEITTVPAVIGSKALAWYNQAVEATTPGTDNAITWGGIGNVRVLNLSDGSGLKSQDQLVMVVPTPTAVIAGSSLLGCFALAQVVRRRLNEAV